MRVGGPFEVFPQVGEYQRHLCALLSDGRRHLDPPRFLRAFRNAITFAPIRNVSDFVRSHILEERPIQVRSLQQALQHYRDIQTRTREARSREEALAAIDHKYQRAEQAERLGLAWRWVEQEAAFNALEAELEPLRGTLERLAAEIAALGARIADLEGQWQLADNALTEANRRLAATNVEQQRERIRAEIRTAQTNLDAANRDIEAARIGLGAVHRLLDSAAQLDDEALVQALQALPPLLRRDEGLLAATWPQDPGAVMTAVARIAPRVAEAVDLMLTRFEQLVREEGDMARALEDLRGRIARLERGDSDLQPATLRLIALLAEHGIAAVPLCDRVDVADEHWRDALESFLGGHREALLVDPGQVREAVGLYRREGKRLNIHGSRVINTLKTAEWRDRRSAGSLAEMAVSDDPHALAYVNQRAGNVLRVETEDELLRHERAITADGMLATGGAVLRLRPEEPMLGREARRLRLAALQDQFIRDGQTHYAKQQEKSAIKDLRERQLMPLNDRLRVFPDLVALTATRQESQADLDRLKAEEQALLDDAEYRPLQDQVARCRAERERIKGQADQAAKDLREREHAEQAQRLALDRKDADAHAVAERRGVIQQTPGFDAQLAAERLEELQAQELFAEESSATWQALGEEAEHRAGVQEKIVINQRAQARDGLTDYWAAWSSEHRPAIGAADDHLPLAAWVVRELTQVRETQLARYVTEADNALKEAETPSAPTSSASSRRTCNCWRRAARSSTATSGTAPSTASITASSSNPSRTSSRCWTGCWTGPRSRAATWAACSTPPTTPTTRTGRPSRGCATCSWRPPGARAAVGAWGLGRAPGGLPPVLPLRRAHERRQGRRRQPGAALPAARQGLRGRAPVPLLRGHRRRPGRRLPHRAGPGRRLSGRHGARRLRRGILQARPPEHGQRPGLPRRAGAPGPAGRAGREVRPDRRARGHHRQRLPRRRQRPHRRRVHQARGPPGAGRGQPGGTTRRQLRFRDPREPP